MRIQEEIRSWRDLVPYVLYWTEALVVGCSSSLGASYSSSYTSGRQTSRTLPPHSCAANSFLTSCCRRCFLPPLVWSALPSTSIALLANPQLQGNRAPPQRSSHLSAGLPRPAPLPTSSVPSFFPPLRCQFFLASFWLRASNITGLQCPKGEPLFPVWWHEASKSQAGRKQDNLKSDGVR